MPYMIYSQYKTAVIDGYKDRPAREIRGQIERATQYRQWLQSLDIASEVRDVVVEQVYAIEEAFQEILRDPNRTQAGDNL